MLCKQCCKLTLKIFDKFCISCGKGILKFGKYKNYTFMYVKITHPDYCEWILNISENMPPHIVEFSTFLKTQMIN